MTTHPSSPSRVAALILAGGKGMRMGGCDKPLLPLNDRTILDTVLDTIAPHCAAMAISANGDAKRYAPWNLPVLPDANTAYGPLAGVLAGLYWARDVGMDTLVTIPGDTPFVPPTLISALSPPTKVAASNGRRHHLVASWPVSCAEALQDWLAATHTYSQRRVRLFADTLNVQEVAFSCQPYDPFFNINTPEDYATAQNRAQETHAHAR